MATLYQVLMFANLPNISHIIWDVDGTITDENGKVNQEVAAKIIRLGLNGVYHSFITGRDAEWLVDNLINPMKGFYNFSRVVDNLTFIAEVGCVMINVDYSGKIGEKTNPLVEHHPLVINTKNIRNVLMKLTYAPGINCSEYDGTSKIVPPKELIYDANQKPWVIDRSEAAPKCYPYIWSPHKKVFATFEKIRNEEGKVKLFEQQPYVDVILKTIEEQGFKDEVGVEVISTAINIVPKIDNVVFGKSWAAGRALEYIWRQKLGGQPTLDTVVSSTISAGDGQADLDFTTPSFSPQYDKLMQNRKLYIIFVGGEQDLPPAGSAKESLKKNIIIQGTGLGGLALDEKVDVIRFQRAKGAMVVNAVLDFLNQWGYFRPF